GTERLRRRKGECLHDADVPEIRKLLTGKFNRGKSFTLLLSIPALFALMELLQATGQPRKTSTIAAVACIYNPVAIGQLATLYVDAAHYFCWVIFFPEPLVCTERQAILRHSIGESSVPLDLHGRKEAQTKRNCTWPQHSGSFSYTPSRGGLAMYRCCMSCRFS